MAELELTPEAVEAVNDAAEATTASLSEDVHEVASQAASLDTMAAPVLEFGTEAEETEKEDSLAQFTADEQRQIRTVADKIDITDSNAVLGYGASAQRKVSDFADGALQSVRAKDMGETGKVLTSLLVELKTNGEEKKSVLGKLFGNAEKSFEKLKAQYSTTEANIDRLVGLLEDHEQQLRKDIIQLDKLYDKNKLYFKEISMYIEAGKLAIEKARNETLPQLEAKAKETN